MECKRLIYRIKITVIAAVPVLTAIAVCFKEKILSLADYFPECMSYRVLGIYCTGCGNTRSVTCLMNGDIIGSVRNNIAPPLILLLLLCLYAELIFSVFGKKVSILPRRFAFWMIFLAVVFLYYILRNYFPILAPPV